MSQFRPDHKIICLFSFTTIQSFSEIRSNGEAWLRLYVENASLCLSGGQTTRLLLSSVEPVDHKVKPHTDCVWCSSFVSDLSIPASAFVPANRLLLRAEPRWVFGAVWTLRSKWIGFLSELSIWTLINFLLCGIDNSHLSAQGSLRVGRHNYSVKPKACLC